MMARQQQPPKQTGLDEGPELPTEGVGETPSPPSPGRQQLTFGEKAVGLTFNPSGDPLVGELKHLYSRIIDICDEERKKVNQGRITTGPPVEAARLWSIAITEAQGAQMWAVKAATWKD